MKLRLVTPNMDVLPSYCAALDEGNFTTMQLGQGDIDRETLERDPAAYLSGLTQAEPFIYSRNGKSYTVTDHELLWIVDDNNRFLGTMALRYAGSPELLDIYAGHVGMAIRPALLNVGYGVRAFNQLAMDLRQRFIDRGLSSIVATCNADNPASARLIQYAGGQLEDTFPDTLFGGVAKRFRLNLNK